jgi:hypothetical protein
MTAAILLRGHFHGLALRLQARRSCDADQTCHLLRPPKDHLGWDFRRLLALARGPAPAVHGVALWLFEANPGTLCRPGIARASPRTCDGNQFLGDTQARDFQNPGLGPCLGCWSGPRSRSHDMAAEGTAATVCQSIGTRAVAICSLPLPEKFLRSQGDLRDGEDLVRI